MKQGERLFIKLQSLGWTKYKDALMAPLETMHEQDRLFEKDDLSELLDTMLSRRQRMARIYGQSPEEGTDALIDVDQLVQAIEEIAK